MCTPEPAPDARALREVAVHLATTAAAFVARRRTELLQGRGDALRGGSVTTKSSETDPVTLADTECERLLRAELHRLRPSDAVLGEEGGASGDAAGLRWVLDPIDGTVNFLYGLAPYAVSVGVQLDGVSVAGAVADVPGGRLFAAARGHGATLDGRELRCTAATDLSLALLLTGFGYDPRRRARQGALLAELLPRVRDVRRSGCASLDLCAVAAGWVDGYYEHGTQPWDWAAGALIAAEAGATVTLPGRREGPQPEDLLTAAAPGVAEQLAAVLHRHAPDGVSS